MFEQHILCENDGTKIVWFQFEIKLLLLRQIMLMSLHKNKSTDNIEYQKALVNRKEISSP